MILRDQTHYNKSVGDFEFELRNQSECSLDIEFIVYNQF